MPVPNAGEWLTELPPHPQAGQEMQPNGPLSATLCAHEEEVWVLGGAVSHSITFAFWVAFFSR